MWEIALNTIVRPPTNPVANNDAYSVMVNNSLVVPAPGVLANDTGPAGLALTAVLVSGPQHGTLSLSPNGSFTYTPAANFLGTDTFTYVASDGVTTSNAATVTITVSMAPPPPPPPPGGTLTEDVFEPNDQSNVATNLPVFQTGQTQSYSNLTVTTHSNGLPDYDWYRWTAGTTGTLTANLTITPVSGSVELHVFMLTANNTLVEVGNSTTPGLTVRTVSVPATAGEQLLVEVKGADYSPGLFGTGFYNMNVTIQ